MRIGEGLVYAADSTSSLFDTISGVSVLTQSFHHAQKLIQIRALPIGILTYGLALIGTRNIESLVAEFQSEVLGDTTSNHDVRLIAEGLRDFLADRYDQTFAPPAQDPATPGVTPLDSRPPLGIVVGGYSGHRFQPEEYAFVLPSRVLHPRPNDNGLMWWGQTESINRLVVGFDINGLTTWMGAKGVDAADLPAITQELKLALGWKIHFDAMPLQDAIDLAVFLANTAIGHSRFVLGPPVCGGHVDVATISHRGFEWIRRKSFKVKADSVFF